FYKRKGKGDSLICLHGFPTSSWDFCQIWDSLTERFDVLVHDLIGLGKSEKPQLPIPISLQADIVENLAINQGVKKAHILAHDLGDTIAQELLARQLENKSKINWLSCVFLNGGIFPETHRPRLIQKLLLSPLGSLVAKITSESIFRKNMIAVFSRKHPPSEEFLVESWKLMTEKQGISMIPRLIKYMKERNVNRDRWVTPLKNSIVPIKLINGIEDPISGIHAAKRFAEVISHADIKYLKNVGHYPHVETPKKVLEAIFEFHDQLSVKY
ncbi:alpha/beta fold hydrolase, partial [Xanthovirga aplysinae]|uniref:alpha/beta fold hydrolase n=1 Tax=Xanthovirga aplysinae TaxID=2529853 RepID=UPI0012BC2DF6